MTGDLRPDLNPAGSQCETRQAKATLFSPAKLLGSVSTTMGHRLESRFPRRGGPFHVTCLEDVPIETRTRRVRLEPCYGWRGFQASVLMIDSPRLQSNGRQHVALFTMVARPRIWPLRFALADIRPMRDGEDYLYRLRSEADMSIQTARLVVQ